MTATAVVKKAAAEANLTLGRLEPDVAHAIVAAAESLVRLGLVGRRS